MGEDLHRIRRKKTVLHRFVIALSFTDKSIDTDLICQPTPGECRSGSGTGLGKEVSLAPRVRAPTSERTLEFSSRQGHVWSPSQFHVVTGRQSGQPVQKLQLRNHKKSTRVNGHDKFYESSVYKLLIRIVVGIKCQIQKRSRKTSSSYPKYFATFLDHFVLESHTLIATRVLSWIKKN